MPKLTDQECRDVLITAAEGGINYWALVREVEPDTIRFQDTVSAKRSMYECTTALVRSAIGKVLEERDCRSDILASIAAGDIDAEAADVIVQVATFGEILYS